MRCLIVGAAPSQHSALFYVLKTQSFDAVFAVDGGYAALHDAGIVPDAVFGDFDSLGYVPNHPFVTRFDTHKDFTDLDWALNHVFENGFSEVIVCDAFEGRLDHSLGNLQLLIQYANRGMQIWGLTESEAIAPLVAPGPFSSISFQAGARGNLSVLSHSDEAQGVNEEGLAYGIADALCLNRVVWGISNELIGKPARISLSQGSLWVFFPLSAFDKAFYSMTAL